MNESGVLGVERWLSIVYVDMMHDAKRAHEVLPFSDDVMPAPNALQAAVTRCDLARCLTWVNIISLPLAAIDGLLQDRSGTGVGRESTCDFVYLCRAFIPLF